MQAARTLRPDVVLMDIRMPVMDGIEATRHLLSEPSSTKVLVLTTYGIDEYVYEALRAGASGFILKTEPPERLVDAVRVVADGDASFSQEITRHLIYRFIATGPSDARPPGELAQPLTPRSASTDTWRMPYGALFPTPR